MRSASQGEASLRDLFQACQVVEFRESQQTRRKRAAGFVLARFAAMYQLNAPVAYSTFEQSMREALSSSDSLSVNLASFTTQGRLEGKTLPTFTTP